MCFDCRSLFGVDCIIFSALPGETCQSQPAQINHRLSCLPRAALLIFLQARSNSGPMVCVLGDLVQRRRVTGEGLRVSQIGIDRNHSLVTAVRGLGEL